MSNISGMEMQRLLKAEAFFGCIPQRKGAEAKQQPEVDEFIAVITTRVAYLSYSFLSLSPPLPPSLSLSFLCF